MPRTNEATDVDLKVIEELGKLGWQRLHNLPLAKGCLVTIESGYIEKICCIRKFG